jgi:hypothetical protein
MKKDLTITTQPNLQNAQTVPVGVFPKRQPKTVLIKKPKR